MNNNKRNYFYDQQIRNKSVDRDRVKSKVNNIVAKIYCGNLNQMVQYYDSNLVNNITKPRRNRSSH